ncbi:MAG: condensation domain-containing protein, partial [Legionellaceae bacterium]|nr:condensation domain-containing protein [Legionellaceae bacterium]
MDFGIEKSQEDDAVLYWKSKLADITPLQIPTDYPRPITIDYHGASVEFELPNELKTLSAKYNVTHYTTLLTGLAITLSRYTGQTDLTIGTPVANRQHPQLEHLIGFFVNTLVLRIQLDSNHTLSQCVSQIQNDLIEAQHHQDLPFEKLVDELGVERDTSRHPVFQVMYTVQYGDVDDDTEEGSISLNYDVAKFDLSIALYIT